MSSTTLNWQATEDLAQQLCADWNQPGEPGGAIILFDINQLRIESSGGLASLESGEKFTTDSIVRYASVTKHIFAALALNAISVNDTLGSHLPMLKGDMSNVTVGQALDMTGGLPDVRETLSQLGVSVYQASEASRLLQFLSQIENLNYPVGTEISYSNTGYRLVEEALKLKGIYFDSLVQSNLSQPLGIQMKAPETWFDIVPGLVPGYWHSAQGWKMASAGLHISASGSLTGSARSLAIWLQTVLANRGTGTGILESLSAIRYLADGRATDYGLGLTRNKLGKYTIIGHGGAHPGYKTHFLLEPNQQVGLVIVSNREDSDTFGAALKLMSTLLGESLPTRSEILPDGLYATADDPIWIEVSGSSVNYLGSGNTVYQGKDNSVFSLSAHLPISLKWTGEAIEGEIGHVPRRFLPVTLIKEGLSEFAGVWRHNDFHAEFTIVGDQLTMGVGPVAMVGTLSAFGQGRALVDWQDGPWALRFCLSFKGDRVDIIANRSRVLSFYRLRLE